MWDRHLHFQCWSNRRAAAGTDRLSSGMRARATSHRFARAARRQAGCDGRLADAPAGGPPARIQAVVAELALRLGAIACKSRAAVLSNPGLDG
jgi:hypothetical protein